MQEVILVLQQVISQYCHCIKIWEQKYSECIQDSIINLKTLNSMAHKTLWDGFICLKATEPL